MPRPRVVREPVQVYLASDDSALLARLAEESGLSKAEVIRQSVRSYARAMQRESPMLRFVAEGADAEWPSGLARGHDAAIAGSHGKPGRRPAGRKRR